MTNLFEYYRGTLDELIQSSKDTKIVGLEKKIAGSPTLMVTHANFGFTCYTLEKALQRYNVFLKYANK